MSLEPTTVDFRLSREEGGSFEGCSEGGIEIDFLLSEDGVASRGEGWVKEVEDRGEGGTRESSVGFDGWSTGFAGWTMGFAGWTIDLRLSDHEVEVADVEEERGG
jgi:hypothetical protein